MKLFFGTLLTLGVVNCRSSSQMSKEYLTETDDGNKYIVTKEEVVLGRRTEKANGLYVTFNSEKQVHGLNMVEL